MFLRCKRRLRDLPLSRKLLLLFTLVLGTACLLSAGALQFSFNIYDEKLYQQSLRELDYFAKETDDTLASVERFTESLAADQNMQRLLTALMGLDYPSGDYSVALYNVRQWVLNEARGEAHVKNVVYIDPHGTAVTVGTATPELSADTVGALLRSFDEARGGYVELAPAEGYPYLIGGRAVLRHTDMSLTPMGWLYVNVDMAEVIGKQENSLSTARSSIFVYTADTMISVLSRVNSTQQIRIAKITA